MKNKFKFKKTVPKYISEISDLRNFRIGDNQKLPNSFVEFASKYGFGRLCNLFIVYIPMRSKHPDSLKSQIRYLTESIKLAIEGDFIDLEPDGNIELLKSAVPFAMGESGHYLFWDVKNIKEGEYPIYVLGPEMGAVWFGANNLYEFIEKCTDEYSVKKILGSGCPKLPYSFEPLIPWNIDK